METMRYHSARVNPRYYLTAFLTGATVMIGEIAAARAIAPHFGTSIIVWTNVIGIILVALSIGYWIGGRISERCVPSPSYSPSQREGEKGAGVGERTLGWIIVTAGVLFIIPAFATRWIAGTLIADLFRIGSGFLVVLIGSFFAVILLFALPIALLGMVSPFLIKLACSGGVQSRTSDKMSKVELRTDVGAIAGRLYAISTIGSLIGTFLPTLVLLPTFGTRRTMLLAAAALIMLGLWLATRGAPRGGAKPSRVLVLILVLVPTVLVLALVLVLVPDRPIPWFLGGTTIAQQDSRYQLLRIVDVPPLEQEGVLARRSFSEGGRGSYDSAVTPPNLAPPAKPLATHGPLPQGEGSVSVDRFLVFNEGLGIQSRAVLDPATIAGYFPIAAAMPSLFLEYSVSSIQYRVSDAAPLQNTEYRIQNTRTPHILILGNAGGTIAHLMQRFFPEAPLDITGVELDPAVTAITAAHFPPPPKPYSVFHADSRVFLRGTDVRYDVIVADAYTSQLTIPPHLVSREFFELVRSRLTQGGVLVANVNAPSRDSVLLRTIEQTIAAAFPHVVIGKAGETWNYLILAGDQPVLGRLPALRSFQLPESAEMEIQRFLETVEPVVGDTSPSTTFWSGKSGAGFTDDWAPLELFTDLEIFEAIRSLQ